MPDPSVVVAQLGASGLDRFLNTFISGMSLGAIYALLALGFVIIFKATQVVNFAHGAIAAIGAYFVVYFAVVLDFPGRFMGDAPNWFKWSLAVMFAVAATALVGLVTERLTIRPMIGEPLFSVAMITIGLEIVIRVSYLELIQKQTRGLGDPWGAPAVDFETGKLIGQFNPFGDVRIAHTQVATVVVALGAMLFLAWFFRSRMGVAMRATAFDQEAAMAQGINVGKVFAAAWGIGAALAALGGVFSSLAPRAPGVTLFTPFFVFRAFPAVILGGLDSVAGAVLGGFAIGLAEVSAGTYLSSVSWLGVGFSGVVPYLVMMAVLLVRPYGLFGTEEIRRV